MSGPGRILVIKLSALGDMVQAFPAFDRIRAVHSDAHITLLTTPLYAGLAAAGPWFDAVDAGGRPASVAGALTLIGRMRRRRWDVVYDLQGNDRTNALFQALRPFPPRWSGVAFGCTLPHRNPDRMRMHTLERQAEQLRDAGIWPDAPAAPGTAPAPDVSWMLALAPTVPAEALAEPRPVALLVPGAAPHRPAKRWPAARYADLARRLGDQGLAVQILGGGGEADLAGGIASAAPGAANLAGRTDFAGIAALGARAVLAVGNDTGPMHLIAAAGAPSVCLFSAGSDPALCAPRGAITVLRRPDLADLPVGDVLDAAAATMANWRR
ncbi:MAG TPA: glycosyltransferase family 9 protein [Caulobacteraceae bacterium]|nr:glycosyltransferase family 9 protein [Caulobacteraceae bacterium]